MTIPDTFGSQSTTASERQWLNAYVNRGRLIGTIGAELSVLASEMADLGGSTGGIMLEVLRRQEPYLRVYRWLALVEAIDQHSTVSACAEALAYKDEKQLVSELSAAVDGLVTEGYGDTIPSEIRHQFADRSATRGGGFTL